ncbi:MAG: VanZ family protein [Candidatus Acidiferrum sp.]
MDQFSQGSYSKKGIAGLFVLLTLSMLFSTLWPFDPFPRNRVSWLEHSNGLRFSQRGVVLSQGPLFSTGETPCTLELWIEPAQTDLVSAVLVSYEPHNPWRFLIKQYHGGLIVSHDIPARFRRPRTFKIDIHDVLRRNQLSFITITSSEKGTSVYVDGRLKKSFPRFRIGLDDLSGQLVFGSSTVHFDPWAGEAHGIAIYAWQFTPDEVAKSYDDWTAAEGSSKTQSHGALVKYTFSERAGTIVHDQGDSKKDLFIPTTYRVPHHSFLTPPWREFNPAWDYYSDVLQNIAGFMPFGFLLCALLTFVRRSRHPIFYTILLGCLLSFCIELIQAYIPQRGSGVTDIITNTLGTALGAMLMQFKMIRNLFERVVGDSFAKIAGSVSD